MSHALWIALPWIGMVPRIMSHALHEPCIMDRIALDRDGATHCAVHYMIHALWIALPWIGMVPRIMSHALHEPCIMDRIALDRDGAMHCAVHYKSHALWIALPWIGMVPRIEPCTIRAMHYGSHCPGSGWCHAL